MPFVLTNYALGVTRVKLRHFVLGTFGLTPIVLVYAAFGSASGAGPRPDGSSPISGKILVAGVIVTVALALFLARITQRALVEAEVAKAKTDALASPV